MVDTSHRSAATAPARSERFARCAGSLALSLTLALGGLGGAAAQAAPPPQVDVSAVAKADPGSSLSAGWQHGAFMEIFVRAYKDSDGDGIGDLRGITQSLDYLKDLGIRGIWLMPVTPSEDHDHGYAVVDFRGVEAQYGSMADFDELLAQAHARGIGVIVDYVINHSATQNPIFRSSASGIDNPYRNWYVWQDPAPTGWHIYNKNPWYPTPNGAYLGQFSVAMPDFNFRNPQVLNYHQDTMRFWLNRGVDGFRFDAVKHLVENGPDAWGDQPESFALMGRLRANLKSYAQRYMVCEAASQPIAWAAEEACGSTFAFGLQYDIVSAARGSEDAVARVADYFRTAPPTMATMLSNHDLFAGERLWDQVGGNLAQYRLAAASYLLLPGTPFIYYGEEVGMSAGRGLSGDRKLRTPMSWTANSDNAGFSTGVPFRVAAANVATQNRAAQLGDPNSLLSFYKDMLGLRNTRPSIARGSYEAAFARGRVMGFQRRLATERTLVLLNFGSGEAQVEVGELVALSPVVALYPKGAAALAANASGVLSVRLPARSVQVFQLEP